MDAFRDHFMGSLFRMKASPIPNDDMFIARVLSFNLLQKSARPLQAYAWSLDKDRLAFDRIECPITITPIILALPKLVRAPSL